MLSYLAVDEIIYGTIVVSSDVLSANVNLDAAAIDCKDSNQIQKVIHIYRTYVNDGFIIVHLRWDVVRLKSFATQSLG